MDYRRSEAKRNEIPRKTQGNKTGLPSLLIERHRKAKPIPHDQKGDMKESVRKLGLFMGMGRYFTWNHK